MKAEYELDWETQLMTRQCHKKFIHYISEMACTERFSCLVRIKDLKCDVPSNIIVLDANIKK